jgi:putative transcriptional regulator
MPTLPEFPPLPPMSEAAIMANALSDIDNPQLSEADLVRLKPLPKARALRIRLRLTQEEFAARYHIPLGTLRDWEQRRASFETAFRASSG